MNPICSKGAVRSQLHGMESIPFHLSLFEIIDDRKHSNSNKVYIDIDIHNGQCVVGYSNRATEENIDNTVKWFGNDSSQNTSKNIASKGIGLKFYEFKVLGKWQHHSIDKDNKMYFYTEINTTEINKARLDVKISDDIFAKILKRQTRWISQIEVHDIFPSVGNIFKNDDSKYPFKAKTVFICKNMDIINSLDEYKDDGGYNFEDIIKRFRIKYYSEIDKGFELFIKLPGYTEFTQIKNGASKDIIGTTIKSDELNIDLFIDDDYYLHYTFRLNENSYKFAKNGNSTRREKIENITKQADFKLILFKNEIKSWKDYIIGKSIEKLYTGAYVNIGDTFISDVACPWSIDKRNLEGHSKFRLVLKCISEKAKMCIRTSGLKSQFDLTTMSKLHEVCKQFTNIYKTYIKYNKPDNSDDYALVTSTSNKQSVGNKNMQGYLYLNNVGEYFYKFGYDTTQKRIWEHGRQFSNYSM